MWQFPNSTDLPPTNVGVYFSMDCVEHTVHEILTTTNDDNDLTSLSDPSIAIPSSPPTKKTQERHSSQSL